MGIGGIISISPGLAKHIRGGGQIAGKIVVIGHLTSSVIADGADPPLKVVVEAHIALPGVVADKNQATLQIVSVVMGMSLRIGQGRQAAVFIEDVDAQRAVGVVVGNRRTVLP